MSLRIDFDRAALAAICHKWHVAELAFFGSVLRADFGPDSDIDVLVTFRDGMTPGLGLITLQDELSTLFGRQVDLVTKAALYHRLRERVLAEAEVQFAA